MRHFCDLPPAQSSDDDDDDMHDMDDMDEIHDGADDEDDDDGRDDDAIFCTGVTPMHPDASQLEV